MVYKKQTGVPKFECTEFESKSKDYVILIPIINEGTRIIKELRRAYKYKVYDVADIVICDGGSIDGCTEESNLRKLKVNTLLVKQDTGKQGAQLRMGIWWALQRGYKGILTIDGNNKDSIEDVPRFIEKLQEGYDLVQGSRFVPGGRAIHTPFIRTVSVRLIHAPIISLTAHQKFTDTTNAYRAYSSRYLRDERVKPLRDVFMTYELLAYLSVRATQLGYKACEIPVTRTYPKKGKTPTKISFWKGNSELMKILIKNVLGAYKPDEGSKEKEEKPAMAQKQDGRVIYADLLRVFATLAVIVLHVAGSQFLAVPIGSPDWTALNLYDSLAHCCVPLFIMLSGMFMLDVKRPLPLSKLFFHNILRLLTALLFWGGVYAAADYILAFDRTDPVTLKGIGNALIHMLHGNSHYHLWFLYMMMGLYIVTPIVRLCIQSAKRRDFLYFFLVTFFFARFCPAAFQVWPNATAFFRSWYYQMDVQVVMGYVGYYVAGYYLQTYPLSRPSRIGIYLLGLSSAAVTFWGTQMFSIREGWLVEYFYLYGWPNVALMAAAIMVLFRYGLEGKEDRPLIQWLSGISRITFGIYLVHDLFLILLYKLEITTISFAPAALATPLLAVFVFLCALIAAWFLDHVPLLNQWIM